MYILHVHIPPLTVGRSHALMQILRVRIPVHGVLWPHISMHILWMLILVSPHIPLNILLVHSPPHTPTRILHLHIPPHAIRCPHAPCHILPRHNPPYICVHIPIPVLPSHTHRVHLLMRSIHMYVLWIHIWPHLTTRLPPPNWAVLRGHRKPAPRYHFVSHTTT